MTGLAFARLVNIKDIPEIGYYRYYREPHAAIPPAIAVDFRKAVITFPLAHETPRSSCAFGRFSPVHG